VGGGKKKKTLTSFEGQGGMGQKSGEKNYWVEYLFGIPMHRKGGELGGKKVKW